MKFTLGWLKEHLDTTASLDDILDKLTLVGLEVEGVEDRAKGIRGFVTAKVIEAKQHPNADRLRVCRVDNGSEEVELVCGAPNARTGMVGVFAPSGSFIPGTGITLKPTDIRGVTSNGMLLSEREMQLSDEHDGIVELDEETAIGLPAAEALGLDDPVIEIAITPNRGDCLGVRGIARDLAAAGVGTLKPLPTEPVPGAFESPIKVRLDFPEGAKDACPYFVGRTIRGVTNGESPKWLKERLLAIGLRPISALVDITNLMTFDLNRPLHVFDAKKVEGDLTVRLAAPGETLAALNERTYELDGEMVVIADAGGPEALGGVMGGEPSGVTAETTDVFVESAYFDPVRTAATGRKLNLQSDARFRFERGIDPEFLEPGAELATRLILDICGGEPSELTVAGGPPAERQTVTLRPSRIAALGGVEVSGEEIVRILAALGFSVADGDEADSLAVTVPSWRSDIEGEACLVEEVVRIHGYDRIPTTALPRVQVVPEPALDPEKQRRARVRRALAGRGLIEAVTYSFLSRDQAAHFGGVPEALTIANPISADLDALRPSVLPNLVAALGRNADRGIPNGRLFEIGPRFSGPVPGEQEWVAAGVRLGETGPRHWDAKPRPVDAFDAKADALAALAELGAPVDKLQVATEAPGWYHPGRSGVLRLGPKNVLAHFGELHPAVAGELGVKGPVAAFEVFVDAVPMPRAKAETARPHLTLATLQPISRDFAFVVDADVEAGRVIAAARGADKELISEVELFDVYQGKGMAEGKKSLAVAVTLQPVDKTPTDEELDAVARKIVDAVAKATGAELRG